MELAVKLAVAAAAGCWLLAAVWLHIYEPNFILLSWVEASDVYREVQGDVY
jgi:hypothetical protein